MSKWLVVFSISFFSFIMVRGQNIAIQGQFTYTEGFEQVRLIGFQDSLQVLAKSSIKEGDFALQLANVKSGIYRLQYGPSAMAHYVDIILTPNEKVIGLTMDLREEVKEPQFTGSVINQKLQVYLKQQKELFKQLRFQYQTYHTAPDKNQKTAQLSKKEFATTHKKLQQLEQSFLKENSNNLAGWYVQARPLWLPTLAMEPTVLNNSRFESYWSRLPISAKEMSNTPFYYTYLMEYLGYYFNQRIAPEPWEAQMKKAVTTVMQYMSQTLYTQSLALKYLLENFKALGHEGLLQFVDENYAQSAQCLEASLQEDVTFRLKSYDIGKLGQEVPNLTLTATQDLHSLIKGKTVLVFWSSTCPHCMEEWPAIAAWEKMHPEYQIIAISLDTDTTAYEAAKAKLPINIKYICDFKGYESEYVKPFYIMATPTIFEVDSNKKFVKKGKVIQQFGE